MALDLPPPIERKEYRVPSLHPGGMGTDAYDLPLWVATEAGIERFRQDLEWSGTEAGRVHNRTKLTAAATCNLEMDTAAIPYITAPPDASMNAEVSMKEVVRKIRDASPLRIVPMKLTTIVKYNPDGEIDNNFQIGDMQILTGSDKKAGETYLDMVQESMQLVEATVNSHVKSVKALGQRSRLEPLIGYQAPDGIVPMEETRLLSNVMDRRVGPSYKVKNGNQNFGKWKVERVMCVREHTYRHPDIGEYKIPVLHVRIEATRLHLAIRLVPEVTQVNALWETVLENMVYQQYVNTWLNHEHWLDLVWNPKYENPRTQEEKKVVEQFNSKAELSRAMMRQIPQNPLIQRYDRLDTNELQVSYYLQDSDTGAKCPALELVLAMQPQLQKESDAAIARKKREDAKKALEEEIARSTSEKRDREEAGLDDEDSQNKRTKVTSNGQKNQSEEGSEEGTEDSANGPSEDASSA